MRELTTAIDRFDVVIEIGGVPIRLHTSDPAFVELLQDRYVGFLGSGNSAAFDFEIDLTGPGTGDPDADVRVVQSAGVWSFERGDFRAEWDPATSRGRIRQSANPYSIDSVLRIVHTLVLAKEGGFLVHAASAIRNGKAFLFAGVSGAGKTTISRLAPPDAILLTDEISYVREEGEGMRPSARRSPASWRKAGENVSAPIAALYLLAQGPENRDRAVRRGRSRTRAAREHSFFCRGSEAGADGVSSGVRFRRCACRCTG